MCDYYCCFYVFFLCPLLVHHYSIDTPSKLWSMYGVSMEYVWSIFGGSGGFVQSNTLKNKDDLCLGCFLIKET